MGCIGTMAKYVHKLDYHKDDKSGKLKFTDSVNLFKIMEALVT